MRCMKIGKLALLFTVFAALAGCAHTSSVISLNDGTYMVAGSGGGGLRSFAHLESLALAKARNYCANMNKSMVIIKSHNTGVPTWTQVESDVTFKCVSNRTE